jgi:hypothetical protein
MISFCNYKGDSIILDNSVLNFNNKRHHIINNHVFNKMLSGKVETDQYIFKYSKSLGCLFNKKTNEFIERFEQKTLTNDNNLQMKIQETENNNLKFEIKKGKVLVLDNNRISIFESEKLTLEDIVISENFCGKDKILTTKMCNTLVISKERNSKWNGSPIGKIY